MRFVRRRTHPLYLNDIFARLGDEPGNFNAARQDAERRSRASRLPARSVLLPSAEVATGDPHPQRPAPLPVSDGGRGTATNIPIRE